MTEGLKGKFYATGVGSLPYKDAKTACEKVLNNFKDMPFWPQLVRRAFLENMYVQFSEKIPGVVVDQNEKKIYIDTRQDLTKEVEKLYERFLKDDVDFFSISKDRAEGLYRFIETVKASARKPRFLKGHIIGPVSYGLTVTDQKRQAIFHNSEMREAVLKTLLMRARWQIRKIKETGADCVIFIDEPYLASIGSRYVILRKEDASLALDEIIQAIHKEGALCGMHCCGNTDWGFLLGLGIDILNFDAYNFCDSLSLYQDELAAFLDKGGMLAWGIVPTSQEVLNESDGSLIERLTKGVELLARKGIKRDKILSSMLITPSCGLGILDEGLADIIIERLIAVSGRLQKAN